MNYKPKVGDKVILNCNSEKWNEGFKGIPLVIQNISRNWLLKLLVTKEPGPGYRHYFNTTISFYSAHVKPYELKPLLYRHLLEE